LQAVEQERVFRELKRVAVLREVYSSREENKDAEMRLEHLRIEWRAYAIHTRQRTQEDISERVSRMNKLPEWERGRRERWEYAILQKVNTWHRLRPMLLPSESVLNPNEVQTEETNMRSAPSLPPTYPNDGYGINVAELTLKRGSRNDSSFTELYVRGYPLQDILYGKRGHQIRQIHQKDGETQRLRYFHFPSNSMHWVEV
jgi:hypothetical protein